MTELLADCDHFIAGAALIGGISYFHTYAYDLLATERADHRRRRATPRSRRTQAGTAAEGHLPVSSSMVFESTDRWPSVEGDERKVPPPLSSYGFQKLAVEYFAHAAWDQYQLPYTIVRPFNCVGIGESRALGDVEIDSGNVKLAMSHVVPDLVQKVLKGQDPLHILGDGDQVRHYTYGGDLARGIVECVERDEAAQRGLQPLHRRVDHRARAGRADLAQGQRPGRAVPLRQRPRLRARRAEARPATSTRPSDVLGFEATTSLSDMLDEVIPWIAQAIKDGTI